MRHKRYVITCVNFFLSRVNCVRLLLSIYFVLTCLYSELLISFCGRRSSDRITLIFVCFGIFIVRLITGLSRSALIFGMISK